MRVPVAAAQPLRVERTAMPESRQAVALSIQERDAAKSDQPGIRGDAFAAYNHRGTVVVASAWLALYVIASLC